MSDIGPGDFVEYVGKPEGYVNGSGLEWKPGLGSVHQVMSVGHRCLDGAGNIWESIRVPGLPPGRRGRQTSVPVAAFRPIYRPKPDAFADLLKTPDRVGEPA